MRYWSAAISLAVSVGFQVFSAVSAEAQDAKDSKQVAAAASVSEQLLASQAWPTFRSVDEPARKLKVASILRYTNMTRILNPDEAVAGLVLLCVDQGRPVAAIQVYAWDGHVCHELDYLARRPNYAATYQGGVEWRPESVAMEYHRCPNAAAPNAAANRRLLEMKTLARRFRCTLTGWEEDDSDRQALRLMPSALYRYQVVDSLQTRGSFDGAVFAFAQGTDPEALLLIEAVRDAQGEHWEYGFCRATSGGLEATLGDAKVWQAEKYPPTHSRLPHFTYKRPLQTD